MAVSFSILPYSCQVFIAISLLLRCTLSDKYLLVELEPENIDNDILPMPMPDPNELDQMQIDREPELEDDDGIDDEIQPGKDVDIDDVVDQDVDDSPPDTTELKPSPISKKSRGKGFRSSDIRPPVRGYRMGWGDPTTTPNAPPRKDPVDCVMGQWEQWSEWSCDNKADDCGKCTTTRVKRVKRRCDNGGDCSCKEETEKDREYKACPVDCVMGQWERWGRWSCENDDENCGKCTKERVKKEKRRCRNGGDCSCKEETEKDEKDTPCRTTKRSNPSTEPTTKNPGEWRMLRGRHPPASPPQ